MIGIIPMVMGKKPEDNKPQGGPMGKYFLMQQCQRE